MVKKLFKHEILSYVRTLLPVQLILLGIAAIGRFVQIFENDSTAYNAVLISSIVVYVIGFFASTLLTTVMVVVRFYKNLFSSEGYLSFTLPVTPSQHILVKLLVATLAEISTFVVTGLSLVIITAGDVFLEIQKAASYLWDKLYSLCDAHLPLYIIEFVILIAVGIMSGCLLYYTCISVGQLFRKNRIFAAVGVYFGYYMFTQAIATAISILATALYDYLPIEKLMDFFSRDPYLFAHLAMCGVILLEVLLGVAYFFIIRFVISKKLNLE